MLKIKIGSTWAETQDAEVPVTLRSPLFLDDGRIPGSFIFNFSLPNTPAMKDEIDYLQRPARHGSKPQQKPFYLEAGALKFYGTCSIVNASDTSIEVNAPINTGSLASILKEMTMRGIDMEGDRVAPKYNFHFLFTLETLLANGSFTFKLFVNGAMHLYELLVNGENIIETDIFLSPSDVVTWTITAESQPTENPDEFSVDFSLLAGTISITYNSTEQALADISSYLVFNQTSSDPFTLIEPIWFNDITTNLISLLNTNGTSATWTDTSIVESLTKFYPDEDFVVFPIENRKFMDKYPDDYFSIDHRSAKAAYTNFYPVLNYFKNGGFPSVLSATVNDEQIFAYNLFCPFVYLAYFVKRMFTQLELNVSNNVFEEIDLKQLVIYNAFAENNFSDTNLLQIVDTFDLKNHLPDSTLSDFLNDVLKLLAIAIDYNSVTRTVRLANMKDIVADRSFIAFPGLISSKPYLKLNLYKGYKLSQVSSDDEYVNEFFDSLSASSVTGSVATYLDLPEDPAINDIYYVELTKTYYIWTYDEETSSITWKHFSFDFDHIKQQSDDGDGEILTIESSWSAVMDFAGTDSSANAPAGRSWRIPRIDQAGNFAGMPSFFRSEFSKCLLFYRGMQNDLLSQPYPMGSNGVYRYNNTKISGADLSLNWNGEYGLYEKRHKAWVEWLVNNPGYFTCKASLSSLQLASIDWFKWYRIMHHDFLIREIRFNIYNDRISECELDLMRR